MTLQQDSTKGKYIFVILLAVFLDLLGITIIIPVIPALFEGDNAPFEFSSVEIRSMFYGLLIGSYSVMQFIGAPILGAFSDKYGRRPILTISLIGAFMGYLLFGWAISAGIFWLLFIARMIPGFMGGNLAVIYSSLADISKPQDRAKNFGLVGAAFGLGFTIGPGVGGFLADNTIVSWFSYATPFWFTALLTLINLILVRLFFPETLKNKSEKKISVFEGIKNIAKVFRIPKLRGILTIVLFIQLGFTFFTQFYSIILYRDLGFSVKEVGFLFLWIGIWMTFTQSFLVRILSGKIDQRKLLSITIPILTVLVILLVFSDNVVLAYTVNALIAIAFGLTSPNLTALVSNEAPDHRQGEVLGINQSVNSVGQLVPPLIGGFILALGTHYPVLVGGLVIMVASILFWVKQRK
ncbi:MFS transporter [Maribacter sp. CXY002]|uniref:MFS transporter n=1 Tax=Maribacter luteocoastalis TaxID=3407671 RepID=UPI003B67E894